MRERYKNALMWALYAALVLFVLVVQTVSGWAMTLITLYSGFDYMKRNWDIVADGATSKK